MAQALLALAAVLIALVLLSLFRPRPGGPPYGY